MAGIFSFDDIPSWLNPARNIMETGREFNAQLPGLLSSGFHAGMQQAQQQQVMEQRGIDMKRDQLLLDAQTQAKAGQAVFAGTIADIARNGEWTNPEARAKIWDIGSKFPSIIETPAWINAMSNFQKSDAAEIQRLKAESQVEALKERTAVADERTGIMRDRLDLEREKAASKGAAGEPIITDIGGGIKLARMPGATTLHVIRPDGSSREPNINELKSALEVVSDPIAKQHIEDQISLKAGGRPWAIPSDKPSVTPAAGAAPVSKENQPVTKLNTADDVKNAFKAGKLTRDEATKILIRDFGYKE